MRAAAALLALALAPGALLAAQGGWTPPQPPCDLPPANSKINNAITALKTASEKPESRDQQLAQAKRLLSDAILQDKQDANPAAWYYLGRLAVIASDVAGADSALARAAALLASRGNDDSALVYYRLAAKAAGADTAFARDKRDALANAWHLVVRRVQGHPAAQRVLRLRAGLDSMQRGITGDSTVLARLLASSQSRKTRGTRLAPADQ